jgi:hypothetical protein
MNAEFSGFVRLHPSGEAATHLPARLLAHLPLSRPRRRRFAAGTRSDAPSGASNCSF